MSNLFKLKSSFKPAGDQGKAIKELVQGLNQGFDKQTLLGVTGSGKTFTIANVIKEFGKATLVLAHNKTLAFQLYQELKDFFPENKVEYFISYYDYYQPESYIPSTDTYIEKDALINPKIELLRLAATTSLLTRKDVIVVASVSCIYSLGNPKPYLEKSFELSVGDKIDRKELISKLIKLQYERNDVELVPGRFRVKGNTIDLILGYDKNVFRLSLMDDKINSIKEYKMPDFVEVESLKEIKVFPAKMFVFDDSVMDDAISQIRTDLDERLPEIEKINPLFAHRLKQKVNYDMEMIKEMGYCKGIENYSRYFDGRIVGQKPFCLIDYFPDDFLFILDESHQTLPQLRAMYKGDKSRKEQLIDYGFRLPSALDNRPLKFNEIEKYFHHTIFLSATPSDYELEESKKVVEQIIRPTGLVDPVIIVKKSKNQMQDLLLEIDICIKKGFRVLVTTLTKRLSEDLSEFLASNGVKVRYLHSEIDALERIEIIRELRLGKFDVIVGINLLREGLDLPEVGLVAILDADKEGFLRNDKSLIQTIGRAARNSESKVIMYADKETDSIKNTIKETDRRRKIQLEYNLKNNITPKTIIKEVSDIYSLEELRSDNKKRKVTVSSIPKNLIPQTIIEYEFEMKKAVNELDFEKAILYRDKIKELEKQI
jgi:excinuclease ABC subunit B